MSDEPEMVQCQECDLSFYVIAANDPWIMAGRTFQNFCPRCGADMTDDEVLCRNVRRHVVHGSQVYSDALPAYGPLALNFFHAMVDHLRRYVVGRVHTNGLENFWSLLKRALKGTYVAVAPFHLERYLDEQTFRFNERDTDDSGRFRRVLNAVVGKRLTYRILTAKDDAGFMGIA